jgi:predicted DNA-binding ribbon-helix-helix protein
MTEKPSYHDLHITCEDMERTSIFNLAYNIRVQCTRCGGWEVWHKPDRYRDEELLAGEYAGPGKGLILDVAGHVIVDSINRQDEDVAVKEVTVEDEHPVDDQGRVVMSFDIEDDTFISLARLAHKHDVTINKMVEIVIRAVYERETSKDDEIPS